jgi:tetratricopeptide (TPR) repeat protein
MNAVNSFVAHSLFSFYGLGEIFIFIIILLGFISANQTDEDNLVNIYILCYLGIVSTLSPCLCMKIWNRIFLPLLPFIIHYFINGLLLIIFRLSQFINLQFFRKKGWLLIVGLGILFVGNLLFIMRLGMANINYVSNYEQLMGRAKKKHSLLWYMDELSINDWVKEKTSIKDVFICSNPPLFYLNTNRRAVYFEKEPYCPNFKRDPEEIEFIIKDKKIKYIITDNEEQDEIIGKLNGLKESKLIIVPLVMFQSLDQKTAKIYKVIETDLQSKKLNAQGVYWFNYKNLKKAIASLKRAIEVHSNFAGYFNLGSCYEKKGLVDDALKYYKKAINLQPNYEIAINRVNFLRQKEIVKNKPNNSKEYLLLGKLYLKNYNYSGAIISFKRAIQLKPQLWRGYYNLGLVYTCVQKHDLAVLQIEKAIKMNPDLQDKAKCLLEFIKKQNNRES